MPFAIPPPLQGNNISPYRHDYSQWRQKWQCGKARECYQRGIDLDNLAEEFYHSLMGGTGGGLPAPDVPEVSPPAHMEIPILPARRPDHLAAHYFPSFFGFHSRANRSASAI